MTVTAPRISKVLKEGGYYSYGSGLHSPMTLQENQTARSLDCDVIVIGELAWLFANPRNMLRVEEAMGRETLKYRRELRNIEAA